MCANTNVAHLLDKISRKFLWNSGEFFQKSQIPKKFYENSEISEEFSGRMMSGSKCAHASTYFLSKRNRAKKMKIFKFGEILLEFTVFCQQQATNMLKLSFEGTGDNKQVGLHLRLLIF